MKTHPSLLRIELPRFLFTSFARAKSKAKKATLLLFSVAVLLAGSAAPMRGQAILDAFDPSPNANDVVLSENFDGVTAPALPAGWVATNPDPGNGVLWVTSTITPDTLPNAAFIDDQDGISDKVLDSPPITISSASAVLRFRNNFDMEFSGGFYWDGGVLEVSSPNINGEPSPTLPMQPSAAALSRAATLVMSTARAETLWRDEWRGVGFREATSTRW